jgi:hypothetical protein
MREFPTKASYYSCIVESADTALARDPADTLYREVTFNRSGGHFFWDDGASKIHESPTDHEEASLAYELQRVLVIAAKNQLAKINKTISTSSVNKVSMRLSVTFGLLLETVTKIAKRDPPLALSIKVAMAKIAYSTTKRSLPEFIDEHCSANLGDGEKYCAMF